MTLVMLASAEKVKNSLKKFHFTNLTREMRVFAGLQVCRHTNRRKRGQIRVIKTCQLQTFFFQIIVIVHEAWAHLRISRMLL